MPLAASSLMPGLIAESRHRSVAEPVPASAALMASTPAAQGRVSRIDRKLVLGCVLVILALLDINCVMWAIPIADQLAEWAGVSILHSIWVGVAAMAAMVPVVLILTVFGWRRLVR